MWCLEKIVSMNNKKEPLKGSQHPPHTERVVEALKRLEEAKNDLSRAEQELQRALASEGR